MYSYMYQMDGENKIADIMYKSPIQIKKLPFGKYADHYENRYSKSGFQLLDSKFVQGGMESINPKTVLMQVPLNQDARAWGLP